MKKIIMTFALLLLTACGSTSRSVDNSTSNDDEMFRMSMNMGCKIKYNDKERCNCQTDIIFDAATPELRSGFINDPEKHNLELLEIFLENSDELEVCEGLSKAS